MTEPAVDLGIVIALFSAFRDIPISDSLLAFGEVGLSGELRAVPQAEQRVLEAKKLGFEKVIIPQANAKAVAGIGGIRIIPCAALRDALREATE